MNILITTSSFNSSVDNDRLNIVRNSHKRRLSEDEIKELNKHYEPVGIIAGVEPITRDVLKQNPQLRVISRCGAGLDSIDLEAADELGIIVKNTPDAPVKPVAELTIGLILNQLRYIAKTSNQIKAGEWSRPMGNLLNGKTAGIIGCGKIGSYVGRLLNAFGCQVMGYDHYHQEEMENIFKMVELQELVRKSDIVSLHIPYSDSNKHIVNEEFLRKMKPDSLLVNTARGGLVDEDALYRVLKERLIKGACIDCFEEEPYRGRLTELENVTLTGHIGSYAYEARTEQEVQAVENLLLELKKLGEM